MRMQGGVQVTRVRVLNVLDDLGFAPMLDGYPVADMTMLIVP